MDIEKAFDQSNEEYSAGKTYQTNYFNLKEDGTYQIRIVSGFAPLGQHWIGGKPSVCFGMHRGCKVCVEVEKSVAEINGRQDLADDEKKKQIFNLPTVNVQFVCNVIDRSDKGVKLAKLPYSVAKVINEWAKDPEYPFNKDGSPAFDIKITKETKNKKTTYTTNLVPSSIGKALTKKEQEALASTDNDPERFVTAMKKKGAQEAGIDVEKLDFDDSKKKKGEELPTIQADENLPPAKDEVNVEDIPF